jgi:hypothetical protein
MRKRPIILFRTRRNRIIDARLWVGDGCSAAPSCYAYTCNGHDPSVYNCSWSHPMRAYAHDGTGQTVVNLTNWWSDSCHTNWAAASLTAYGLSQRYRFYVSIHGVDGRNVDHFYCYPSPLNDSGQQYEGCDGQTNAYGGPYLAWTDMVEGTNVTYAQVVVKDVTSMVTIDVVGVSQ